MKLIIAVVRPFTVEKIVLAFEDIENFPGMIVADSEGFGQNHEALDPFKPYTRIEIACKDEIADEIVEAIRTHAHTGKRGDGIIVAVPTEQGMLI